MNPRQHVTQADEGRFSVAPHHVPTVVVVDPDFEAYKPLAASARMGRLKLYFRSSAADAMKLARRLKVDAWLVAPDLDDSAGSDFIALLENIVADPQLAVVGSGAFGQAATLSPPISFDDLERLIGLPAEARSVVVPTESAARSLVTLPVGVTAAAVAIAVLMLS